MGVLLPESLLRTEFFAVLAAFVAINTIVYVTLAVAKILPKVYVSDWIGSPQPARARPAASTPTRRSERPDARVADAVGVPRGSETQVTSL